MIRRGLLAAFRFSSINQPPSVLVHERQELSDNGWRIPDKSHQRSKETHLSNAELLISKVPVIYVDTNIVRCMGGTALNAGHPTEYIQLNTRNPDKPSICKYCGLRYQMVHDHGHDGHGHGHAQHGQTQHLDHK